jgi:hypothetical protein
LRAALPLLLVAAACQRAPTNDIVETSDASSTAKRDRADAAPVNVTPLPAASVDALVNPENLPAYTGETGSVEGVIRVTGAPPKATPDDFKKCPDAAAIYGKAFREGPAVEGARALADAVVVVTGYKGFFLPEKTEAKVVHIRGCGFEDRTVTLTMGQGLVVKNDSKELWTPKLEPAPPGLVMMATPFGEAVKIVPRRVGYHRLYDHDRKYAYAELYVFRHPLHTTTRLDGTYRIDGVPIGKVKVNTMHPQIDGAEATKEIEVHAGVITKVDLSLANAAPAATPTPSSSGPYRPQLH